MSGGGVKHGTPQVKCCREGRLEVELGEWSLCATCSPGGDDGAEKEESPEVNNHHPQRATGSRHYYTAGADEPRTYMRCLRQVMCSVFDRSDLRILSADIGLGDDFVTNEKLEAECQRIIGECHRQGKLQDLLRECRERRPKTVFPDMPQEPEILAPRMASRGGRVVIAAGPEMLANVQELFLRLREMQPAELRIWVKEHFSLEELKDLMFDLEIGEADFQMDTAATVSRQLIEYFERNEMLPKLCGYLAKMKAGRPGV